MELKELQLKASINVDTTVADLMPWDSQTKVRANNGIERDGGVTNLYTQVESNTQFDKTLYTRNDKRVRLQLDSVNNAFRVYSNENEVGRVPLWCVESRGLLTVDANDIMATVDGTYLVLKIAASLATIQEVDEAFNVLNYRSFGIPATISDGFLVRNKAPTYANVTSIAGVFANSNKLNFSIITDASVVYSITNQNGFVNASQVFAYYENGWIVASNDKTDGRTFLLRSTGVQQGTYTEATMLVANYNQGTDAITFQGYRDVIALGTPTTYGKTFTPPASAGGSWTIGDLTNTAATPVDQYFTFGGYELCYGSATKVAYFANNTATPRSWTIGHSTPSEIYGYLDNGADVAFKTHTILGDGAYLSASFSPDGIGVPITEIGELNGFYFPHILKMTDGRYRVVYRRGNGSYAAATLSQDIEINRMQEIAPGVVKINTTSALCVVDANDNDLQYGGNAYNGFVIIGFDAVAPVQKAFVARYRGEWGGSVDTNYKSTGAVLVGTPNLLVIPESVSYTPNNETIDVYYGPPPSSLTYYRSVKDGTAQTIKSALTGTLYVDDQIIPPPIGARYYEMTISLSGTTAIRQPKYDGYQLLNELPGIYQSFILFGQLYLYDGDWIYLATLSANILQGTNRIANALGLALLADSPTTIYFYSSFDNSIYTFDGGQSVGKQMRFTQKGTIVYGLFSPHENTLALFLDNYANGVQVESSVIFNRDGIMTETTLPVTWPFEAYQTTAGIWITKDKFAVKYVYRPIQASTVPIIVFDLDLDGGEWGTAYTDTYDGGQWGTAYADTYDGAPWGTNTYGTISPLIWQTQFLGYSDKVKQSIDRYSFRVYKEDRAQTQIVFDFAQFFENGTITEQKTVTIGDAVNPYDSNGYAYIEFVPSNKNGIAASMKITCNDKIVLLDGFAEVTQAGATVVKNRG